MNCKLILQYDGSKYFGSQKQPKLKTVESTLNQALSILNIDTKLYFSGRTDRDVHATGQVVNVQIPEFWNNLNKLKSKLNHTLPNSIFIRSISKVNDDFHARFSAKKRSYRYIVSTDTVNPFYNDFVSFIDTIDELAIQKAIKHFVGVYDFKNFCKEGSDPHSTVREVYDVKFYKYKGFYIFKFTSNSFLRSQIRLMVGFLLAISGKKRTIEDLKSHLIEDNPQNRFKKPAPANGLYLSKVTYN